VRVIRWLLCLVFLACPALAQAQSFTVEGAAGPTLIDSGHSLAAGFGVMPTSRVGLVFEVERTHLSSQVHSDGRGGSTAFRGGTLTLASAQVRVVPLGPERIGPYGLAGFAAGMSRPNVNDIFPTRLTNGVLATFFGGGIHLPLTAQMSVFADARMMVGAEAGELVAVAPLRGGLAWHF
jgi:hypothetical protein